MDRCQTDILQVNNEDRNRSNTRARVSCADHLPSGHSGTWPQATLLLSLDSATATELPPCTQSNLPPCVVMSCRPTAAPLGRFQKQLPGSERAESRRGETHAHTTTHTCTTRRLSCGKRQTHLHHCCMQHRHSRHLSLHKWSTIAF